MLLRPLVLTLSLTGLLPAQDSTPTKSVWWSQAVSKALQRAGENAPQLRRALQQVAAEQRSSIAFLIEHMPAKDLRSLDAAFLLAHVEFAHQAWRQAPWSSQVSRQLFEEAILPYANVSESRENWGPRLRRFAPLVAHCKSPGEAAQLLNKEIFKRLKVKYSTRRRRADQSPSESIEQGLASCTGLSILLTNACRAAGIPARLAGIPSWVNKRGNHTWVEVWDQGWHFTGAAEPSAKGLNHTWFQRDAALAQKDSRRHAIYAVSYRRTGLRFPMVWARGADPVDAVNVTDRYTRKAAPAARPRSRLLVRVRSHAGGPRVRARVRVLRPNGRRSLHQGESRDEGQDLNDILAFDLRPKRRYLIEVEGLGQRHRQLLGPLEAGQTLHDVQLRSTGDQQVHEAARAWFAADPSRRANLPVPAAVRSALLTDEARVRRICWQALKEADLHRGLRADLAARRVRSGKHESPYLVREVGSRPPGGWPLLIAMHGGGATRQEFNDRQWRSMFRRYRQPEGMDGYLYLSLRAPNNTWNGFYDHYVWPLITRLIRQFAICGDVNPDRVYMIGYSHGGYGAFAIGPNIPDRFAAVHASAAAPTEGLSPARNLRNLRFTFMIGGRDTRHGRARRCQAFSREIAALRDDGPAGDANWGYRVDFEFFPAKGHGGLPDRDKIRSFLPETRQAAPRRVSWTTTGKTVSRLYWLGLRQPRAAQQLEAEIRDNRISVRSQGTQGIELHLDARLVDFSRPLHFDIDGQRDSRRLRPSFDTLCRSMLERGDPALAATARITFSGRR